MNTKVKVGIATAIVAALVALIVLDQKTTPRDDSAAKPAPGGEAITIIGAGADAPAPRLSPEDAERLYDRARKEFAQPVKPEKTTIKDSEPRNEKRISSGEEYVIKEGDSFDSIAKAQYGSASFAGRIAEANPGLKPTALRVGKKIVLPAKAEKKEEPAVVAAPAPAPAPVEIAPAVIAARPAPAPAVQEVGGQKIYTIQAGDTLSGISSKVYGTSRHYKKVLEANKDVIDDPNTLQVGVKLVMPDLPAKSAAPNGAAAGAVATTNPAPVAVPAGAKVVQVPEGGSLWRIAEKFAAEKKIGIHEMMKLIVNANPDKLKDETSLLRQGWQLIIPE